MRISFFEEYPTAENLGKLRSIVFKSTVYIAARSLPEYNQYKNSFRNCDHVTFAYWPLLAKSYWISPFSYTFELHTLVEEIKGRADRDEKLPILLDLEFPVLNRRLYFVNMVYLPRNKRIIRNIFFNQKSFNIDIATAEYPVSSNFKKRIYELIGISYSLRKYRHKKIVMLYTSMRNKKKRKRIKSYIAGIPADIRENYSVGLGTIATGVFGNEPVLPPGLLDEDLKFLKENGMEEAVIFRLGGLNREYLRVLEKYL